MKKKNISKLILKISEGIVARAVDIFLIGVFCFADARPFGRGNVHQQLDRIGRNLEGVSCETLKRAFYAACQKGWLSTGLQITGEGQKRLNSILPRHFDREKAWNGKWYIVSYDIPEGRRYLRNILRSKLEKLGFAQLHKSLWLSPYNFLGDIEDLAKQYEISSFVILAVSDRLGKEPSMDLAERIWRITQLNNDYEIFIDEAEKGKLSKREIVFKYLAILSRDPQLPSELLPSGWNGQEAYQIYKNSIDKDIRKDLKRLNSKR